MKTQPNLLIISPNKVGLTETFIRAHIERLEAQTFYLYGYNLELKTNNDVSLKDFYTPKKSGLDRLKSLLPHHLYFRLERQKQKAFTKEALIKRYIKENAIDVVLAEYGVAGSDIAPICNELNLPLLVHFHGFDASRYDILKRYKETYKFMFQVAKKIVVVSKAMAESLKRLGCPDNKLVLNTYGPHPAYTEITPDYQSDFLISVGRHTYKKAPYLTILAFQKVLEYAPHLKLKMIGDGELFDVSQNLIKSLGLEDNIILLGGLERQEIMQHLESAFVFIQHSLVAANGDSEGTPVGVIEGMAAGLPVVSTYHAGIPDVVQFEITGYLVNENDIDAMAAYIITLANNRILAKQMGLAGKERIATQFTLEKHLTNINQLIHQLESTV